MLKRILNNSSPLGIALTVAGLVLALSPEARRATRRMLVKGTAALMGAVDQVKNMSGNLTTQLAGNPAESEPALPVIAESNANAETGGISEEETPLYH